MKKLFRQKKGVTLVETVVSFALLAIASAVLAGVFLASNKTLSEAEKYETASNEVVAYIRDAEERGLVTKVSTDKELCFKFNGFDIKVSGKLTVLAYHGDTLIEYKIFEVDK